MLCVTWIKCCNERNRATFAVLGKWNCYIFNTCFHILSYFKLLTIISFNLHKSFHLVFIINTTGFWKIIGAPGKRNAFEIKEILERAWMGSQVHDRASDRAVSSLPIYLLSVHERFPREKYLRSRVTLLYLSPCIYF